MPSSRSSVASCLVSAPKPSRSRSYQSIIQRGDTFGSKAKGSLLDFGRLTLPRGKRLREKAADETVWVLMSGRARVQVAGETHEVSRQSLFDEGPSVVHVGANTEVIFEVLSDDCEWTVTRTDNSRKLTPRVYQKTEFASEDRGAGLAQGACRRLVRTVFDYSTQPRSNLVVGEVVNFPGRWSSYPPHHHPQPEVYHYRFTLPQGYGHAELGEDVLRVQHGDTVKIPGGLDHAQVSAPGYGMYYLWIVRHLPRQPYKSFTFTPEHTWLLDPKQQGWQPTPSSSP